MQVKLRFSLVLFAVTCLFGTRASAQDEGQPNPEFQELNQQHPDVSLTDDKTLLMDADVKVSKGQTNSREAVAPVNRNKNDNTVKPSSNDKTEEDPLSFNFLYFIIQKFKISDIIDD